MITVEVWPRPAYVEISAAGQLLNCDLVVSNESPMTWTLTSLQACAYDRHGGLGWRRFLDDNGPTPGIAIVPNRQLPVGARILVFNPVPAFPGDLELARVRFELTYERPGGAEQVATVEVEPVRYVNQARLRLPMTSRLIVWDGHDFGSHHRRWDYLADPFKGLGFDSNAARYSYDLIPVDDEGAMFHGDPARNESWLGFGRPVVAPADGTVVAVVDDRPDDRIVDLTALRQNLLAMFGNYVVVDHGDGEFSVLGHVRQSSARVAVGTAVTAGQPLAAIGASGSSLMPHLHYQLQSTGSGRAEGLPSHFVDFARIRGRTTVEVAQGQIDSGELVESRA